MERNVLAFKMSYMSIILSFSQRLLSIASDAQKLIKEILIV